MSRSHPGRVTAVASLVTLVAVAAFVTAAVAASFTLKVAKHAKVTNFVSHAVTHPNVVVNSKGMVVYTLTGDSKKHPECVKSNGCLAIWPPVTVSSIKRLSRASGVKGKLGTWKRNGFIQVTLDGHPLYTFVEDTHKGVAVGEGIVHFGGTWHVRMAKGSTTTKAPVAGSAPSSGSSW